MKKKMIKVPFVAAIVMVGGINVFNAQESETMSDIALANVEALANLESDGLDWKGFTYNQKERCCARALPSANCSGSYSTCAE